MLTWTGKVKRSTTLHRELQTKNAWSGRNSLLQERAHQLVHTILIVVENFRMERKSM